MLDVLIWLALVATVTCQQVGAVADDSAELRLGNCTISVAPGAPVIRSSCPTEREEALERQLAALTARVAVLEPTPPSSPPLPPPPGQPAVTVQSDISLWSGMGTPSSGTDSGYNFAGNDLTLPDEDHRHPGTNYGPVGSIFITQPFPADTKVEFRFTWTGAGNNEGLGWALASARSRFEHTNIWHAALGLHGGEAYLLSYATSPGLQYWDWTYRASGSANANSFWNAQRTGLLSVNPVGKVCVLRRLANGVVEFDVDGATVVTSPASAESAEAVYLYVRDGDMRSLHWTDVSWTTYG